MPILYWSINGHCIPVDMIIGFHQRSQTIPESDVVLSLDVHSSILSELDYEVQFHNPKRKDIKKRFSSKLYNGSFDLAIPLEVEVRNDSIFEPEECYTIAIINSGHVQHCESFTCNTDEDNKTDFFCLHTLCIEEDDG